MRIRASGYGGSGYFNPINGEKVIGVTTALNAIRQDGITQWAVSQTAAYAVANVDTLLTRSEERGFRMLNWYWNRLKSEDFDDPELDLYNYHTGVLNDLADRGTWMHEFAEAILTGGFEPTPMRDEHDQMADAFLDWYDNNDIEVTQVEGSLFGHAEGIGYGGTADFFGKINGVATLLDFKSSKAVYDSHVAQAAAYGAAEYMVLEVPANTEGSKPYTRTVAGKKITRHYVEKPMPDISEYAILQVRPDDWDNYGEFIPSFAKLHKISQEKVDAGWNMFRGALMIKQGQRAYAVAEKKEAKND